MLRPAAVVRTPAVVPAAAAVAVVTEPTVRAWLLTMVRSPPAASAASVPTALPVLSSTAAPPACTRRASEVMEAEAS